MIAVRPFHETPNAMKKILLLSAVAAAAISAGCATTESTTEPAAERVNREYTTGSNIPKKKTDENVQVYDREALDRARQQMPQTPRPGLGGSQ